MPGPTIDLDPVEEMPKASSLPKAAQSRSIDLADCEFGKNTLRHPFTWLLIGICATLAVQYMMDRRRH